MGSLVNYKNFMIVAAAALDTYKVQHTPGTVMFCLNEAEHSCFTAGEQAVIAHLTAAHIEMRAWQAGDDDEKLIELLAVFLPFMTENDVEENFDKVFRDERIPYVIRSSRSKDDCFAMAV